MKKTAKYLSASLLIFLLTASTLFSMPSKTEAGYADNYNRLYYDLSRLVYQAKDTSYSRNDIEDKINAKHGANKFKVIASVDVNDEKYHDMAATAVYPGHNFGLEETGFKAMAVVAEGSKKLWIAFAGTDKGSLADYNTAINTMSSKTPGQNYQAQLFTNYIYESFPKYQDYKWYFTGHSLGGWLSSKVYLDIRSANWLIADKSKFHHGGPIKKEQISGVYNFNPLPIRKNQLPSIQWEANKDGLYNSYVKNLYLNNEWLNGVYDMNSSELAYIGFRGAITNENILHYSGLNYTSKGVLGDLGDYYRQALTAQKDIVDAHSIKRLEPYVGY